MPTPAAPRAPHHNSPNPVQSTVAAVITVLVLLGLVAQCGSTAETNDSAPTTSAPTTPPAPLDEPLRSAGNEVTVVDDIAPPPLPPPTPAEHYSDDDYSDDTGTDDSGGFAYYKNCSAARAAGAAPLYASDPGYSSDLDRDGDGVACES